MDSDQIVEGAQVVFGFPGTSQMFPQRIAEHTPQVVACGVKLVEHFTEMIGQIDAALILSICGSAHLERARPFLDAGIPVFIDKPFACTLSDALELFALSSRQGVPLWSSSGMRFAPEVQEFASGPGTSGKLLGAVSYGPAKRAPGNPGLLHYGIHATEILCTLMGPGCRTVTSVYTSGAEVVTGEWDDGRIGTVRGQRTGSTAYGFTAFCENGVIPRSASARYSYRNLCQQIVETLKTGKPPVTPRQTLEVIAFCQAALTSEQNGGNPTPLELPPDS